MRVGVEEAVVRCLKAEEVEAEQLILVHEGAQEEVRAAGPWWASEQQAAAAQDESWEVAEAGELRQGPSGGEAAAVRVRHGAEVEEELTRGSGP
jgi:hypothetical protein